MRWQTNFPDNDEGMFVNLKEYSLLELCEMEKEEKLRLDNLRRNEPSSKRKNERQHSIWFAQCQMCIDSLHKIRDAIIEKKQSDI